MNGVEMALNHRQNVLVRLDQSKTVAGEMQKTATVSSPFGIVIVFLNQIRAAKERKDRNAPVLNVC